MKLRYIIMLLACWSNNLLYCQTETCLQNLNHPDIRSIIQVNGNETIIREYIIYAPKDYNAAESVPLLINMHGFGDCASDYAELLQDFYNFKELADQENILIAYPQGAFRPYKDDTFWEPGDTGVDDIFENDIFFFNELIDDISEEYNVDPNNIYACGYSNGGMMAYSLACNLSNRISGIGIMSGTMLEEDCVSDTPIPIIKFHGIDDGVLPYDGNMYFQSVSDVVNFWLDKNEIPQNSLTSTELNGGNVVRDEYSRDDGSSCLSLYTIHEEFDKPGDHVWFSEDIDGVNPNNIMWDFLTSSCDRITSTENFNDSDHEIKVFPNPFNHSIQIESESNLVAKYELTNSQGVSILSGEINTETMTLELNTISSGIYFLNIDKQVHKIFKLNN